MRHRPGSWGQRGGSDGTKRLHRCTEIIVYSHKNCGPLIRVLIPLMAVLTLFSFGEQPPLHAQPGRHIVIVPQLDTTRGPITSPIVRHTLRRPRVGLVLSGGGARGVSQVGVIKVLERQGVPIDFIAATSVGSIIGGLYASGYTTTELESIIVHTPWDEILSLTEETKRTDLFMDQKQAEQRGIIVLRFEGLEPVLPTAVATGQRLTEYLSSLTLQSVYHPSPSFDQLRIPFRAVTTDLVSGRRVVLRDGSLAQALRASATVPLLFTPIEKDGMQLVDGGLLSNIPVDVAFRNGCDIVIAVNSASGLRTEEEMKAPWETADQIMGIMMGPANEAQLKNADVVITPAIGRHLSSDFSGLDSLIQRGEEAATAALGTILRAYERKKGALAVSGGYDTTAVLPRPVFSLAGDGIPDSLWHHIVGDTTSRGLRLVDVQDHVNLIYDLGNYREVRADVTSDSVRTAVVFTTQFNPRIDSVAVLGCRVVPEGDLLLFARPLLGRPLNHRNLRENREDMLRLYRSRGYSLARIDTSSFDARSGLLKCVVNEGVISDIVVEGGTRTKDSYVLSEFPLSVGDVFEISRAREGFRNLNGAGLFEYMYLEVSTAGKQTRLTIRLKERPSQLIRLGLRGDNERNIQGLIDIRDIHFRGGGTELGFTAAGGQRSSGILLEYKSTRLFNTYLTVRVAGFFKSLDSYLYGDAPPPGENKWARMVEGEYRDIRYGTSVSFGTQLERFGTATIEYTLQNARTISLENTQQLEERYQIGSIRIGTDIDSKDRYPFPKSGLGLNLSFEFAANALGSQVSYSALTLAYERYSTVGRFTVRPRITFGFADRAMPFVQQFRLGGQESMFGVREDDRRGRQMLLLNMEFRYFLPIRLLFDSYVRGRFDMGSISEVPEDIKFSTLRYGLGLELALDTPIGPAVFSVGKGFYFGRDLPDNPIQQGPLVLYFMFGFML